MIRPKPSIPTGEHKRLVILGTTLNRQQHRRVGLTQQILERSIREMF
jgi:hypothetical protein